MVDLFSNPDGADGQSQAVLAYLRYIGCIDASWDDSLKRYTAEPLVSRWHNGREQGYVVTMLNELRRQVNIVWFEHRNSDAASGGRLPRPQGRRRPLPQRVLPMLRVALHG